MLYSKPFHVLKHLVAAAAITAWVSSCTKIAKKEVIDTFYQSMSTSNKEAYNILLTAREGTFLNDEDCDLIRISTILQWNDTLAAYILLSIHSDSHSLYVINDLEDMLYPVLFHNKALLTQVFIQVWAVNMNTKKDILRILAEKEEQDKPQENHQEIQKERE